MSLPLVTCMMLTRNRREWLPRAIACYQAQTYANRELLIVMDGEDTRDAIPADQPDTDRQACCGGGPGRSADGHGNVKSPPGSLRTGLFSPRSREAA